MGETKIKPEVSTQGGGGCNERHSQCAETEEKGWSLSKRGSEKASLRLGLSGEIEEGGIHWAEWWGKDIFDQGNRNALDPNQKAGEGMPHSGNCSWAV